MSCEVAISVQNVSKRFEMYAKPRDRLLQLFSGGKRQYFKEFWALRDVSFEVEKGETVGILGRNGSGKSTLLQIIAGTLTPTFGDVQTSGMTTALLELGAGFNAEFSGRENVYLNGAILGFSRNEIELRFDEIAAFADIGKHMDQPVKTYSSGMYVRLAFAVQACIEPKILIVDEALSVGDEKFQRKCFEHIENLRSNGCSVLLVTHSTSTVEKFCQRGILLHQGVIHGVGPAKDIVDQYHALLYSDERAYLRYLNLQQAKEKLSEGGSASSIAGMADANSRPLIGIGLPETGGLRAVIQNWEVVDCDGNLCEAFMTGDRALIRFHVSVLSQISEIQAGILLRTIEGVSAFGTSTMYHKKNYINAQIGNQLRFEFELDLALSPGSFFVTLAIAEAVSHGDMIYLDRKTDVIVLKIDQVRVMGSGIAAIDSNITVTKVD